ncbi:DUF3606 domain-containing protein [Mesorhizobium sp. WSM3876]|uniref:DUF3606 domain-containing protein n=1 Tax=Mesorhizobium sp. WSM3876 TaxID=422277 RepID=UPI000BAFFDC7|nr:DUF3606 domain-containing protein [Mesorhizobium sp. WSM3876]PBB83319.1 DUF3606 domain-containing protein [Mesorhizobium sp. WSM3876]
MPSDSVEQVFRSPNLVSGDIPYEVSYFAAVNGITEEQVRGLIKLHGEDVAVLVSEARKLREASEGTETKTWTSLLKAGGGAQEQ